MTLSIITVNKNNAAGLEKTIQSVVHQTSSDFEYIIIDGASDDNSVEVIKKYSDKINYWVSEPDTGIYNAMNKGIRRASGDYCLFLNSGDFLVSPETLYNVFSEIKNNDSDIFYSDIIKSNNSTFILPDKITIKSQLLTRINHQNSFIKHSLFIEHGLYNENLKMSSDWEFFLSELWNYKSKFFHIKTNIAIYDINGISSNFSYRHNKEDFIALKNVFNEFSDILIENYIYCNSVYYSIINNYGNSKILTLLLRIYRKLAYIFNSKKIQGKV